MVYYEVFVCPLCGMRDVLLLCGVCMSILWKDIGVCGFYVLSGCPLCGMRGV